MPRSLRTMIRLLFAGSVVMVVNAQQPTTRPAFDEGPCSPCHTCEKPTLGNLCLRACMRAAAKELAQERAPNVVILNELEDLYLPVPFDHKGHADMAEMTKGCVVCHHYTPEGTPHPACKACHEVHAGSQLKHIRNEVPFGDMWSYPISFTKTDTGGGCVVGCHKPLDYDRDTPVSYR